MDAKLWDILKKRAEPLQKDKGYIGVEEAVNFVVSRYPGYRLEHFYTLSFLEGGVTQEQLFALYNFKAEEISLEKEFQAGLHDKKMVAADKQKTGSIKPITQRELDAMTQEEKEELTLKWKQAMFNKFGTK